MKKSQAASEFSRTKTIAQQRRSLPVYQVRDELLQVRGWGRWLFACLHAPFALSAPSAVHHNPCSCTPQDVL
jgi:hypothetical protein